MDSVYFHLVLVPHLRESFLQHRIVHWLVDLPKLRLLSYWLLLFELRLLLFEAITVTN